MNTLPAGAEGSGFNMIYSVGRDMYATSFELHSVGSSTLNYTITENTEKKAGRKLHYHSKAHAGAV